jgi:predicted HTH domain antitoxin
MSIVIPEDILQSTRLTTTELMQELAVALFQRDKLTLGQASRLAEMNQWQFQQLLASRGVSPHYDVAEFEADLQTLAEMRQS